MSEICPVCGSTIEDGITKCPECGFKILGGTEEFQPISIYGDSLAVEQRSARSVQLANFTVVSGPQVGTSYLLDDKQLTIGRSPQCDIFLNDMTVSRMHATIAPRDGGFVITDSQSYNGIWINNVSVDQAKLNNGDIVQIGAFCLKFEG